MDEVQKSRRKKKSRHTVVPPEVRRLEEQMFRQGYSVKEILYRVKQEGFEVSEKTVYNHIKPLQNDDAESRKTLLYWTGDIDWQNFSELDAIGIDRGNLRRIRQVELWISYGISTLMYPRLTRRNVWWMDYILTYCPDTAMSSFDLWVIAEELARRDMDNSIHWTIAGLKDVPQVVGLGIDYVISWLISAPWLSQRRYIDWVAPGESRLTEALLPIRGDGYISMDITTMGTTWLRSQLGRMNIAHAIFNECHSLALGNIPSRSLMEWVEIYNEQIKPDPTLSLHHQPLPPELPIIRVNQDYISTDKLPVGLDVRGFRYD